jgi:translation elongation factor EF-Tu-like GTPase
MTRIITLAFIALLAACSEREAPKNAGSDGKKTMPTGPAVVVLGGDTSSTFVDGLRSAGVANAQATSSEKVAERAKLVSSADVAFILVDATQGPLPINREDILLARQFCRGPVIIGFARSASVDDPELLELEELEMRELLNSYELPGETSTVCFDSDQARTKHPRGFPAIAGLLSKLDAVGQAPSSESVQVAEASIYALADLESFKRGLVRPIDNGTFRVVFGHQEVDAEIQVVKAVQPASSGTVSIRLPEPLTLPPGARFVIANQNHVIAAGAITQFKR